MPTYIFCCDKTDGGCNHQFEVTIKIADYDNVSDKLTCPKCSHGNIHRVYQADNVAGYVGGRTVGVIADRNTDKYSLDYKYHLHKKHTEYLRKPEERELPKGMSRYKKDEEGKYLASTKQSKTPKRKPNKNDRKSID